MEHRAFVLRYEDFWRELKPLLESCLASGDREPLVAFIEGDLGSFRDPYEGEPLAEDWEGLLESKDVDQYGDFALTKYYDPTADIGLGAGWLEIQRVLEKSLGTSTAVLGETIGSGDHLFDPGKMGSYFQSAENVRRHLSQVERVGPPLERLASILRKAAAERGGLYVTF